MRKSNISDALTELFNKSMQHFERPRLPELMAVLNGLACDFLRTYLIVDALDECEYHRHRRVFLPILKQLELGPFQLFVTSRPHAADIRKAFTNGLSLKVLAPESDIKMYVNSRIDQDSDLEVFMEADLRSEILSSVAKSSDGM